MAAISPDQPSVLIINGPNLNLLGVREPGIYGRETLGDFRQSNLEGEIVTWVQDARTDHNGIIINAGGYTHTSIALLDALLAVELPVVEVHLSNLSRREPFRHHSYVSQAATGVICGLGSVGYLLALQAMATLITATE